MAIDLTTYRAIKTALFCKLVVPGYETLTFSDYNKPMTIAGQTYTALGGLLSVTETTSDLKATSADVTITISGIPTKNMTDFLTRKIKGSKVTIMRGVFEPNSETLIADANNPVGKFYGFINNYAINETWSELDSTTTITIMCKSAIGLLTYKKAGRRTNPIDMKQYYPGDTSMDRVPSLSGSKIHFGAI
jgi:hypothetical protein